MLFWDGGGGDSESAEMPHLLHQAENVQERATLLLLPRQTKLTVVWTCTWPQCWRDGGLSKPTGVSQG